MLTAAEIETVTYDHVALTAAGSGVGSGGMVVIAEGTCMVRLLQILLRFYHHESCGQCTPCRSGTAKASALMASARWDRPLLADLGQVMRDASICGLGQAAPNVFDCVIKYFPQELQP